MPRSGLNASLMKPLVVLAFPGMYLVYKISEFKRQQQEHNRRKVTERELAHLNHKIDKLLTKLEEHEPELATSQEEECVVCVSAKASMQTFPCGHRVVCRKCFVKTIQVAVSQRVLPLRCVICRTKIVRLKHSSHGRATPVMPGARALLAPCEALGESSGPFLRPHDLERPVEPLPASHYRHSAQACRFHRHRDGTSELAEPSASSSSEASCSTRAPAKSLPCSPVRSPDQVTLITGPLRRDVASSPDEDGRDQEPCGRRITRALVHPAPRSPPDVPKPPPIVDRLSSPPGPSGIPPGTSKEAAPDTPPKLPRSLPSSLSLASPSSSSSSLDIPRDTSSRSSSPRNGTTASKPSPDRLSIPRPSKTPTTKTSPSTCHTPTASPPTRQTSTSPSRTTVSPEPRAIPSQEPSPQALAAAALATVTLPPPPSEVRRRRGGQLHRVSPGNTLPLVVRGPLVKPLVKPPRPSSRFERFRDLHVRRPTPLFPIPEKEEPEVLQLEAAFCRVAPGASDLLVCASSPKISVLQQDRAPLLQPDSPDRRSRSLRSQLRSKMAGFPSLLGSPLRALRAGARHRRVPDVN
ncbi:unnamed protein product [Ixodes hexagonus]